MKDCEKVKELIDELEELEKLSKKDIQFSDLSELKKEKEQLIADIEFYLDINYQLKKRHQLAIKHKFKYVGGITSCGLVNVKTQMGELKVFRLLSDGVCEETEYVQVKDLGEKLTAVYKRNEGWTILDENGIEIGKHINTSGEEEIIKGPYIYCPNECINDRIVVDREDGRYLIDKNGKKILGPCHDIRLGSHNIGFVQQVDKMKYILFDTITEKYLFPQIEFIYIKFFNEFGLAILKGSDKQYVFDCEKREIVKELSNEYGWMDLVSKDRLLSGGEIIDFNNEKIGGPYNDVQGIFYEGVLPVQLKGSNVWILINKNGERISHKEYESMSAFHCGLAQVREYDISDMRDYMFFIDTSGKELPGGHYNYVNDFKHGVAEVRKNDKWFYIDTNGNPIFYIPDQEHK